jgi:UDP-N-acetylglucosamine 2-epimerase (non-hydrolysing)
MKVLHVVGARPNFMKIAPIIEAFDTYNETCEQDAIVTQVLVHTGQHYDATLSDLFFGDLELPRPDVNLGVGSGTHGQQTGQIMVAFDPVLAEHQPDLVVVVGDVNSTIACALDATKLSIPVAHVEAGLRSRDRTMPEEINRIVTDAIADLLFTTDRIADDNLQREGIPAHKIHFVGNVMIDTLLKHRARASGLDTLSRLDLKHGNQVADYALVTLHRPGNVDHRETLLNIGYALSALSAKLKVVFPAHPRTVKTIKTFKLDELFSAHQGIQLLDPLGYLDFLNLQANASIILTDSGGIQEESTILGVPCLTLRPNTERPITIKRGTNRLVESKKDAILAACEAALRQRTNDAAVPPLWDGKAAHRIVNVILDWFCNKSR